MPTLVHDGGVVTDLSVIMEYLEEIEPRTGVMTPSDPLRRGNMRALMRFIDEMPAPAIRVPSYNLAFLPGLQKMTKEEFLAFAECKPLRKEFMLAIGQTGFPQKEMDVVDGSVAPHGSSDGREIEKSGGPWLLGREISLADVSVMPVIVRLADLRQESLWEDKSSIARWLENIRAHPAYAMTYYHGTHLTAALSAFSPTGVRLTSAPLDDRGLFLAKAGAGKAAAHLARANIRNIGRAAQISFGARCGAFPRAFLR